MSREFWIEHKLFVDQMIYEAYPTNEERTNNIPAIHTIEYSAYVELKEKLKIALAALKKIDSFYVDYELGELSNEARIAREALLKIKEE